MRSTGKLKDNLTPRTSCSSCDSEVSLHLSHVETAAAQFHQYGTVLSKEDSATSSTISHYASSCCKTFAWCLYQHLIAFTGLAMATYVGVSSRIGLIEFSQWDGITHFPSFWAQVVGTFIIGAAVGQKDSLQKSFGFLYTIITTGVCGSMTTFSSWNVEASKALLQLNESSLELIRHSISDAGTGLVGCMTVLLLGVGMPVAVFHLGKNISAALPSGNCMNSNDIHHTMAGSDEIHSSCLVAFHDRRPWFFPSLSIIAFCIATTLSIVVVCFVTEQYHILFSLLLGGPGTYIRWCLSSLDQKNIRFIGKFPIGTFIANITGTLILAIITVLSINYTSNTTATISIDFIPLAVMTGIGTGFCGSLTTVSTFVSQICSLSFRVSLCYAFLSLVTAQIIINVVFLSYQLMV